MSGTRAVDVCVIGGGLLGCATAHYACSAGLSCLVLEERDLAAGASGAAFGGVSVGIYSYASARVPPAYVELSKASLALYGQLAEELGPPMDLEAPGSLDPFFEPGTFQSRRERVEGLRACGVPCELLSREEVLKIEPALSPDIAGASYCSVDATVTPLNVVSALASHARQRGAEIRTHTKVQEIIVENGRAVGVRTPSGTIHAGSVVITAGIGAPALAATVGVHIPMDCSRGQMFVTERVPHLLNTYVHNIKQTPSGTIVFGVTRESGIIDTSTTVAGTRQVTAWALKVVPALAPMRVIRSWAGIRSVPADGYPIIGRVDGIENLLLSVMHRGVSLAPVAGKLLVDMILSRPIELDLEPFRLDRFAALGNRGPIAVEEQYYAAG
jgi:sarcosine oxidase subunit beta